MTTQGVTFYYGISPGQDMRYCEQKEQDLLEAKTRCLHIMHDHEMYFYICLINLRQLEQLGCKGFAVLWDDIEPELSEEDAKHFASFAEAHCKVTKTSSWRFTCIQISCYTHNIYVIHIYKIFVQVTNSLHEALQRPKMLLCPVEYCSSRAVPGVFFFGVIQELERASIDSPGNFFIFHSAQHQCHASNSGSRLQYQCNSGP